MLRGIGASRQGMAWEQKRTEVISDNVSNINTDGYRRRMAVGAEFERMLLYRFGDNLPPRTLPPAVGALGHGAALVDVATDQRAGMARQTGDPLHVMLDGPGEFVFQTAQGSGYTRAGEFRMDPAGRLVTQQGYPVLVDGKPLESGGKQVTLRTDGGVELDGAYAGRLDIRGGAGTRLAVGFVEGSNVDLSQELTDLITALRGFQINQRALQIQDQTLSKAVNELGSIS